MGGSNVAFNPNAVKFDGTNDYLTRGADLTGIADSKSGILSVWLRQDYDIAGANNQFLISPVAAGSRVQFFLGSNNKIFLRGYNAATTKILDINSSPFSKSPKWIHFLASWDLATGVLNLYSNDTSDLTTTTNTNDTIDYAGGADWCIGNDFASHTIPFFGSMAELYFAPGQYLDFSNSTNRRKFIDANGLPVSLGATGSTPTGSQPAIYLKGDKSAFGVNSGSGGNFTLTGALETASQNPSVSALSNNPVVSFDKAYVNAAKYDGSTGYLTRGADLTGIADGKTGLFSAWIRLDASGSLHTLLANVIANARFGITKTAANKFRVLGKNAAGTTILDQGTTVAYTASPAELHVLMSWDLNATTAYIYINNVSDVTSVTKTNDTIDYVTGTPNWAVGAETDATNKFNGAISELFFSTEYLDLSNSANRAKFIDSNGNPVYLGTDGSLPTGTAPAIYLNNRAALIGTNAGTGGNFTVNGTVVDANSTPLYYYSEPVQSWSASNYTSRGAALTGIAASSTGTISAWMRLDGSNATEMWILGGATSRVILRRSTSNTIQMLVEDSAGTNYAIWTSTSTFTASAVWIHVCAAWNVNAAAGARTFQMYINDVADGSLSSDVGVAFNAYYNDTNWGVGASNAGGVPMNGALSDVYFAPGQYLDLSNVTNRRKFITSTLRPVFLGKDGSLPTGSQPAIYLANPYSSFQTNLGSGGNFTVTGALSRGTTSGSDVQYP